MSDGGLPAGVGKTALGVAAVRAAESRRADRLFDDPYAEAFLAAAPGAFDIEQRAGTGEMSSWGAAFLSHAVTRTWFFDDYLLAATTGGVGHRRTSTSTRSGRRGRRRPVGLPSSAGV